MALHQNPWSAFVSGGCAEQFPSPWLAFHSKSPRAHCTCLLYLTRCLHKIYARSQHETRGHNAVSRLTQHKQWFRDYTRYKLFHLLILQIHSIQVFHIQNNRHCSQRIVSHNITPAFQLFKKETPSTLSWSCPIVLAELFGACAGPWQKSSDGGYPTKPKPPINNQKQNKREMLWEAISWMGRKSKECRKNRQAVFLFDILEQAFQPSRVDVGRITWILGPTPCRVKLCPTLGCRTGLASNCTGKRPSKHRLIGPSSALLFGLG